MNMNVFNWSYRTSYYLTHPWKWVSELFSNMRAAYRRARYGWCYMDVWELGYWLLEILPPMLRHMAEHGYGYPGDEEFPTYESWKKWLCDTADELVALREENIENRNEYEKDFHNSFCWKHEERDPETNSLTITWNESPEYQEISKKYFARMEELEKDRQERLIKVFMDIGKHLPALWD